MTPIQQLMLGVGGAKKTYLDDVFNAYIRQSTGANSTVNNGINLSGEGGMVWTKSRGEDGGSREHVMVDTVRGVTKSIQANNTSVEQTTTSSSPAANANMWSSFNSNGFTVGPDQYHGYVNYGTNHSLAHWTFRKAPGFFDIVTYTGNGTARTIAHNLGCVPGAIWIKNLDSSESWACYHKATGASYITFLNSDTEGGTGNDPWNNTAPTSTHFSLKTDGQVNNNGDNFIAYLFAGGESTAATARSINFNGSSDYLEIADHADFDVGTNWTAECWFKADALNGNWDAIFGQWSSGYLLEYVGTDLRFYLPDSSYKSLGAVPIAQWHHVAISKQGSTTRIFLNGTQVVADFDMGTTTSGNPFRIGGNIGGAGYFNGQVSNVRIVQGTAVYTSSFKPPTEPLTNITNTVLLCCNGSSVTGSTVTPGTITTPGSSAPNAYTDSPFDDPAGFVFGDSGDQNIIKCGSYKTDSNEDATIDIGWEPQWILTKRTDAAGDWRVYDSMRGLSDAHDVKDNAGASMILEPNDSSAEASSSKIGLTSTGFYADQDGANRTYFYIAIRRSDGYVGKPAAAGTDVFAMDTGNSSSTIPAFDSGFVVDFFSQRNPTSAHKWNSPSRLTKTNYLNLDTAEAEKTNLSSYVAFDSNVGVGKQWDSNHQAWMWKRHAGFDVVTYTGNGVAGRPIPHSLNKAPEMVWIKLRDRDNHNWVVGHKGLDGGTNPWQKFMYLNTTDSEANGSWNDTAPTANHLVLGGGGLINGDADPFIALLFASVSGISKVGYYDGSESEQTITTGFQPRFVIIKRVNTAESWYVLDTTRGWASGVDQALKLDTNTAQDNSYDFGAPTSTGFTLTGNNLRFNNGGDKFIYYAHA